MLRSRTTQLTATAVLAMAALSACSPLQSGGAVIVGDQRTTDAEIQSRVTQILGLRGVPASNQNAALTTQLGQAQVDQIIQAALWQRTADDLGVTVSPAQAVQTRARLVALAKQALPGFTGGDDKVLETVLASEGATLDVAPAGTDTFLRTLNLQNAVAAAEATKLKVSPADPKTVAAVRSARQRAATEVSIKVSPRYGEYDSSTAGLVLATPEWLRTVTSPQMPELAGE